LCFRTDVSKMNNKSYYFILMVFLWGGCQKQSKPLPYHEQILSKIELTKKYSQNVSLDSLANAFPWNQWEYEIFRPDSVYQFEFQDFNREVIKGLLVKFPEDYLAFGLFKRYATGGQSNSFSYLRGETWVIHNRDFICTLYLDSGKTWTQIKINEFSKLGDPRYTLPQIFKSFPLKTRISQTEVVYPRYFLGKMDIGEAIGAQYPCFLEKALLFRTLEYSTDQPVPDVFKEFSLKKSENHPQNQAFWGKTEYGESVYILAQKRGFLGVLGCSDSIRTVELVGQAQKMNSLMP